MDFRNYQTPENLFIFKTNITCRQDIDKLIPVMTSHQSIADWWVDIEDIDKVMRIEALDKIKPKDVIVLVNDLGFICEPLDT